jgi:hypothetical protein
MAGHAVRITSTCAGSAPHYRCSFGSCRVRDADLTVRQAHEITETTQHRLLHHVGRLTGAIIHVTRQTASKCTPSPRTTDSLTESFIALAHASGIPVIGVYETMPTPGYDYQSWMLAEVNALDKAVTAGVSTEHL